MLCPQHIHLQQRSPKNTSITGGVSETKPRAQKAGGRAQLCSASAPNPTRRPYAMHACMYVRRRRRRQQKGIHFLEFSSRGSGQAAKTFPTGEEKTKGKRRNTSEPHSDIKKRNSSRPRCSQQQQQPRTSCNNNKLSSDRYLSLRTAWSVVLHRRRGRQHAKSTLHRATSPAATSRLRIATPNESTRQQHQD